MPDLSNIISQFIKLIAFCTLKEANSKCNLNHYIYPFNYKNIGNYQKKKKIYQGSFDFEKLDLSIHELKYPFKKDKDSLMNNYHLQKEEINVIHNINKDQNHDDKTIQNEINESILNKLGHNENRILEENKKKKEKMFTDNKLKTQKNFFSRTTLNKLLIKEKNYLGQNKIMIDPKFYNS